MVCIRGNKTKISGPTWIGRTQTGLINLLSGLLERNQCCAAAECDESIMHRDDQTTDALHRMFTFGKTAHAVRYIYYDKSLK